MRKKGITRAYLISKYPVTNAQFNVFVRGGGYRNASDWKEAAAQGWWQDGKFKGRYDSEQRERAYDFGSPFNLDNHPVVGVSWFEAVAFCRWLDDKLKAAKPSQKLKVWRSGRIEEIQLPMSNFQLRLPTEAEWEKAARGTDGRIYPWKSEITPQHANYSDANINATSAVGAFPLGASPYGVMDLSGNAWEWCSTKWIENYKDYDKKAKDRENLEGDATRVLRGGAFHNSRPNVRCAYRFGLDPNLRGSDYGFRVVVSPF